MGKMGRLLTILFIVWAVALAIFVQRAMFWIDVMDELNDQPFSRPPGDRSMTPEEIADLNEADRRAGLFGAGGFAFGYFGFNGLFMLWLREHRGKEASRTRVHGR